MVVDGNGKISHISLEFDPKDENIRYLKALKPIKKGDFIVKIPEAMIYSPEHLQIKTFCEKYSHLKLKHNNESLCLTLWVLNERKYISKSKFQNFIAFLPNKFNNFPINFDGHDRKLCKNSFLLDIVDSERNYLNEDFKTLKEEKLLKHITKKEYYQAYTLFQSRTYQYTNNNKQSVSAFIPLVDLFNYKGSEVSGQNKVTWKYDTTTNEFVVYAYDDIETGSKVRVT